MNWSSGLSWWAALKLRDEPRFCPTDRADMGTAFGLDASMGAAPPPVAETLSASPPVTPDTWARRLVRRSGL